MTTDEYNRIEAAKRVLRENDYVVIPKDRRVVLTVSEAADAELMSLMQEPSLSDYRKHADGVAARMLGMELWQQGYVVKSERVGDGPRGLVSRYQIGIIKPREPEDHR